MTETNKIKTAAKLHHRPTLCDMPFDELLVTVAELADSRHECAGKPLAERRAAAEWAYDSDMANDLFNRG